MPKPTLRLTRREYTLLMKGGSLHDKANAAEVAYDGARAIVEAASRFCTRWQVEVQATGVRATNAQGTKGETRAKRKQEDALAVFLAAKEWLRECQEAAALGYGSLLAAREALFAFNDKRAAAQEKKR